MKIKTKYKIFIKNFSNFKDIFIKILEYFHLIFKKSKGYYVKDLTFSKSNNIFI